MRTASTFLGRVARMPPWTVCALPGLLFFLVSLVGLNRIPYAGHDEVFPASTALTLVEQGRFAREITAGSLGTNTFDAFPPMWIFLLAATYKLFGVGIWTTRIPSILAAGLAISFLSGAVYSTTKSRAKALLAGLLYACDPLLLLRARAGRPEPLSLMFVALGILALCQPSRVSWWVGGLCLAMGVASHPFAAVSAFAVVCGLLALKDARRVLCVGAGGLTGVALWSIWLWGHGDLFRAQVLETGQNYTEPIVLALLHEWRRYYAIAWIHKAPTLIPVLLLAPIVGIGWLRPHSDRVTQALCVAGGAAVILMACAGQKSADHYLVYVSPFAYFVLGQSALEAPGTERNIARALAACSVLAGLAVIAGLSIKLAREWTCRDERRFDAAVAPILAPIIASGELVVGPGSLWLPTVERGGKLRVIFDEFDPKTETLLKGFLDNEEALAAAGIIAVDERSNILLARYPTLRSELNARIRAPVLKNPCGSDSWGTLSFFKRPAGRSGIR